MEEEKKSMPAWYPRVIEFSFPRLWFFLVSLRLGTTVGTSVIDNKIFGLMRSFGNWTLRDTQVTICPWPSVQPVSPWNTVAHTSASSSRQTPRLRRQHLPWTFAGCESPSQVQEVKPLDLSWNQVTYASWFILVLKQEKKDAMKKVRSPDPGTQVPPASFWSLFPGTTYFCLLDSVWYIQNLFFLRRPFQKTYCG